MQYSSTRNKNLKASASQAILHGIASDGGLYVDHYLRKVKIDLPSLASMNYLQMATAILHRMFRDYSEEQIKECVHLAYLDTFTRKEVTPLVMVGNHAILELFHGPTAAFKDIALQLLPHLMKESLSIHKEKKDIVILTATSGDTGKAALESFKNVKQTKIIVFYPKDGVSPMQQLQMTTQEGDNLAVCGVDGNFDDAQSGVKQLFSKQLPSLEGIVSSANSINIGRLMPQVVYYFYSYLQLVKQGKISLGQEINFSVPTGNFGNILAGYYAKTLGLPIHKLLCASNQNNVLYEFIKTGRYNRNHPLHKTMSPSMDILISSNLERLLYDMSGNRDAYIKLLMEELQATGTYQVSEDILNQIQSVFYPSYSTDQQTKDAIKTVFEQERYLMDPHTAIAYRAMKEYQEETNDSRLCVVLATASPYKFARDVYQSLYGTMEEKNEFAIMEQLSRRTKTCIPRVLSKINNKSIRHFDVIAKEEMESYVLATIEKLR